MPRRRLQIRVTVAFRPGAGMGNGALLGVADGLRIAPDRTRLILGLPRFPRLAAARELGSAQLDVERALGGIDFDDIAVLEQTDRAADCGFGADMTDAEAARAAREATVGDQRHVLAGALAVKRGRRRQHLAHAGAAARSFV